jgi:TrmH family RNA methyltransferase|tara:strand:- start:712 stop:1524 length:813 start_codon:yes stop_codon:yes gene_type:complete
MSSSPPNLITSLQNPRVKDLVRLRDARHRRRAGCFLIEGERELERAIESGWELSTLFFAPESFLRPDAMDLVEKASERSIEVVQLSKSVFAKAAYRENPDGLLGIAPERPRSLEDLTLSKPAFLLIAQGVEKPGNLGALMRSANAAGADALILCDAVCDVYNPNAIRASQGAFFDLPIVETSSAEALLFLEEQHIQPVTLTPHAEDQLWDIDLKAPTALVLGPEDKGLSQEWLEAPCRPAKLPMSGITDSLNVSVTAGIALFEAVRQRSK